MAYSRKIIQNGFIKESGESQIYLRIIINRVKKILPIAISWPVNYFDKPQGLVKPRFKDDTLAADYNLIINQALTKANDIFVYYRLTGQALTIDKFVKDFKNDLSKKDLLKYMSEKSKMRYKDKEITYSTYKDHQKTFRKLQLYADVIPFNHIDENWGFTFDAFMKKNIKSRNGDSNNIRWAHHKNIRTYIRLAIKEHVKVINPYTYFKISPKDGNWKAIYEGDVMKLWGFYKNKSNADNLRKAVARFLFMVYTGLRRSDLDRVCSSWLIDGELQFVAQKNKRFGKVTKVPLSRDAIELYNDALAERPDGQHLFRYYSDVRSNDYLSRVAKKLEITSPIHHHIGRHTFITLLLKNGASLDMTSKYAGHATVTQTMKYNHPDEERRKKEIKVMDLIRPARP